MNNVLLENIQEHLSMLDLALKSSEKITFYAQKENVDAVILETENRERLVNLIGRIQSSIEDQINQLNPSLLQSTDMDILKAWFQDLHQLSEKMLESDNKTVEILAEQKEHTTKEIATIFKNKEMFKGYNYSSKK